MSMGDGGDRAHRPTAPGRPHSWTANVEGPSGASDIDWSASRADRIAQELPPARYAREMAHRQQIGASIQHRLAVQRKAAGPAGAARIPQGGGSALPAEVRSRMEPKLDADL